MSFEETPTQKMRALQAGKQPETSKDNVTELLLIAPAHLAALAKGVRDSLDGARTLQKYVEAHHAEMTSRMDGLETAVKSRLSSDASMVRAAKTFGLVAAGAVVEALTSGRLAEAAGVLIKALGG